MARLLIAFAILAWPPVTATGSQCHLLWRTRRL